MHSHTHTFTHKCSPSMQVARAAYPDPTASDPAHPLHDAKQHVATAKAKSKAKAAEEGEVTSGVVSNDKATDGNEAIATEAAARWWAVGLKAVRGLPCPVLLPALKAQLELGEMVLLKQPRLSVQPVAADEWATISSMAENEGRINVVLIEEATPKASTDAKDQGTSAKKRTRSGTRRRN